MSLEGFYQEQEDKTFGPEQVNQEQSCTPMETCSPILGLSMGTEDELGHTFCPPQGWTNTAHLALISEDRGNHLPRSPGLGNLQESLYVEYCGWLYGVPENSLPKLKRQRQNKRSFALR